MKNNKIWIWVAVIVVIVIVAVIAMNMGNKNETDVEETISEEDPNAEALDNETVFETDGASSAEAEEVEGTAQD